MIIIPIKLHYHLHYHITTLHILFRHTHIFTFNGTPKIKNSVYIKYHLMVPLNGTTQYHITIFSHFIKEYVGVVMWHGAMPETVELNTGFLMFKLGMVKMAVAGSHIHCKHTMFKDFWSHYSILSISSFIMFLVLCYVWMIYSSSPGFSYPSPFSKGQTAVTSARCELQFRHPIFREVGALGNVQVVFWSVRNHQVGWW